jgi:hypothetical protein
LNFAREKQEIMELEKADIFCLLCFFAGILCKLHKLVFANFLPFSDFISRLELCVNNLQKLKKKKRNKT